LVQFAGLAHASLPPRPVHLAIGMFDGVHLGHRSVIEAAVQSARRSGGIAAVLTFAPHPSVVFRPDNPTPLIMDVATKAARLRQLGVEAVIVEPFTPNYAKIAAEEFLPHLRGSHQVTRSSPRRMMPAPRMQAVRPAVFRCSLRIRQAETLDILWQPFEEVMNRILMINRRPHS
jgi:hypothetical protein